MTVAAPAERRSLSAAARRRIVIFAFLVLPVSFLVVFSLYPIGQLIYLSLTSWDGIDLHKEFVGTANYQQLAEDPKLIKPLFNSIYYFIGSLIQLLLAMWFAVILNNKLAGARLFRTVLFLPFVLNTVAVALIFRDMFLIKGGIDHFMELIGLGAFKQQWVQNPAIAPWSLAAASVWRYLGFNLVVTFGALQSIPADQYEAARLEGANEWQQFRYITLPSIKMILGLQVILSGIGSIEVFEIPRLITNGAQGTKSFVMVVLEQAFKFSDVGLASAMAVVMAAMVMVLVGMQRAFTASQGGNK